MLTAYVSFASKRSCWAGSRGPPRHDRFARHPDPDLYGALLAVGHDRPYRHAPVRLL